METINTIKSLQSRLSQLCPLLTQNDRKIECDHILNTINQLADTVSNTNELFSKRFSKKLRKWRELNLFGLIDDEDAQ